MQLYTVLWSKIGIVELTIIIATVGMIKPIDSCKTNTQCNNPASTSSILSKKQL